MNFIDRTGHIFLLDSYSEIPIGYEYEEMPYIFWFDTEKGSKLSVDNYYFKPIRIVTPVEEGDTINIDIKIDKSNLFYLIDSATIDEQLLNTNNINDSISLFEKVVKSKQSLSFVEQIDLTNGGFTGCIVDESDEEHQIEIGTEEYYVDSLSSMEYKGEIISWDEFDGEYLKADGTFGNKDEVDEDTLFGIFTVGLLNKPIYKIISKRTRNVIVTDENRNNIIGGTTIKKELYLITTFYVVVNSKEQGIWTTNILINVNDDWCPITVGAEIVDEQEELIINGENIGIKLPKEIVRAIYSANYNVDTADEQVYYNKLKEYLLNFMKIKGEMGNYRSAITALKWFEWGDKLTISKLIKNDNRVQRQYVKDFFDLINDNLYSYQLFKDTSLLSISLDLDEELEQEKQHLNEPFWGEGKPILINKFNELREVKYDEKEYPYIKGYFDFTFNDLGLKLAALKYYYEKYFLPLYIKLHNVYMNKQVYANDIKFIVKTSHGITANPIFISSQNGYSTNESESNESNATINNVSSNIIINNGFNVVYFNRYYKKDITKEYSENNLLYVDSDFNEFTHYTKEFVESDTNPYYVINETCLRIPIELPHNDGGWEYYDVNIILSKYIDNTIDDVTIEKNNKIISNVTELLNKHFSFIQTDDKKYQGLVLYPKLINELNGKIFDSLYWLNNKFRLDLIVNNSLYEFIFTTKMPEFNIEMGTLTYKYDNHFKQISGIEDGNIKFNAYMYLPNLVNVNNIDFTEDIETIHLLSNNLIEYINTNYKENIKILNKKYLNACHLLKLTDLNGEEIPFNSESINKEDLWTNDEQTNLFNLHFNLNENKNIELYSEFFNEDGSYKFDESLLKINNYDYDLYLMHDFEKWYIILISKQCIDYTSDKDKKFKFGNNSKKIKIGNYILTYERSDRKFLLNRYYYTPANGVNQFYKDDLIVTSLKNNDKLSLKLSHGTKWNIIPLSLGMKNVQTITSNTELAIISISNNYSEYEKGYYSLSLQYSVDDITNHIQTKKTQFKILDKYR